MADIPNTVKTTKAYSLSFKLKISIEENINIDAIRNSIEYLIRTKKKLYLVNNLACFPREKDMFSVKYFVFFSTLICLKLINPSLKFLNICSDRLFALNPNLEIFFEKINLFTKIKKRNIKNKNKNTWELMKKSIVTIKKIKIKSLTSFKPTYKRLIN